MSPSTERIEPDLPSPADPPARGDLRTHRGRHSRPILRLVAPFALAALLLVGWQLAVNWTHVDPTIVPSPARVLRNGWAVGDQLVANAIPTVQETLLGLAIATVFAWAVAALCDFFILARASVMPLLVVSQTIPLPAIAPLLVIWFGFALTPKVLIVALVTFFPMGLALLQGFASTSAEATDLFRSFGTSRWRQFLRLRVPTALPYFFTGLKLAVTYGVVGAVFAEYVGSESGLGIFMQIAKAARRTDLVIAAAALSAVISLALYGLVILLEHLILPYRRSGDRS